MRFYYCDVSLFRLNPRIHTVEITLPFVVKEMEQPLDGTLKEIVFTWQNTWHFQILSHEMHKMGLNHLIHQLNQKFNYHRERKTRRPG